MSREGYDRWLRSKEPAKSSHTSHHTSSSTASTAFLASTPKSETWVIDSGHYCRRGSSLLSHIHSLSHLETVTIVDGRSCSVTGKGIAQPTSSIPLSNVLYVPNLDVNLLSISALTKALYCSVKFFPYHCEFQDLQTGARIGLGRETGRGLYELVPDSPSVGLSCLLSVKTSSILWHCRLSHPNLSKLKEALPGTSLFNYKCESCELGKHFRVTYHRRDSIPCEHPFDLVHCDIWGPARSTSLSGFRYYLVLVDDFSRVSWVYLLIDRTEVLQRLREFLQEVRTQWSTTPKFLHTDNALEFTQTPLQDLSKSLGMIHQTTCPYTSQQNGVAERKHRHILDMRRTLMLEMMIPDYLWADAVLTSTYLINHLPSSPLGGEIPLWRLHPQGDLFPLPPRVFGCMAFVQDYTPNKSKLAPRALKGVFVGYAKTQKGYRIYLPTKRK